MESRVFPPAGEAPDEAALLLVRSAGEADSYGADSSMTRWRSAVDHMMVSAQARHNQKQKKSPSSSSSSSSTSKVPSIMCDTNGQRVVLHAMLSAFSELMQPALQQLLSPSAAAGGIKNLKGSALQPSLFLAPCCTDQLPPVLAPDRCSPQTPTTGPTIDQRAPHPQLSRSGTDPSVMWVHQGEYGFIVGDPGDTSAQRHCWIGSVDATSCVVVGVRARVIDQQAECVGMVHLDKAGDGMSATIHELLYEMVLPGLLSMPTSQVPPRGSITVEVEWYVVGGMMDDTYALPILADLSYHLSHLDAVREVVVPTRAPSPRAGDEPSGTCTTIAAVRLSHVLRLDGVCVWDMNSAVLPTDVSGQPASHRRCCVWGIQIALGAQGLCMPCAMLPGTRGYPAAALRDICCGVYRRISPSMVSRRAQEGEGAAFLFRTQPAHSAAIRAIAWPPVSAGSSADGAAGVHCSATYAAFFADFVQRCANTVSQLMIDDAGDWMERGRWLPWVLEVLQWSQLQRGAAQRIGAMPDAEFLNWSTTPQCEPPDFAYCLRRKLILQSLLPVEWIFGGGDDGPQATGGGEGGRTLSHKMQAPLVLFSC